MNLSVIEEDAEGDLENCAKILDRASSPSKRTQTPFKPQKMCPSFTNHVYGRKVFKRKMEDFKIGMHLQSRT